MANSMGRKEWFITGKQAHSGEVCSKHYQGKICRSTNKSKQKPTQELCKYFMKLSLNHSLSKSFWWCKHFSFFQSCHDPDSIKTRWKHGPMDREQLCCENGRKQTPSGRRPHAGWLSKTPLFLPPPPGFCLSPTYSAALSSSQPWAATLSQWPPLTFFPQPGALVCLGYFPSTPIYSPVPKCPLSSPLLSTV